MPCEARFRLVAINIFTFLLHFLVFTQDQTPDGVWAGSLASPHTALNLRVTKKALIAGGRVAVRKVLEVVTAKQGPADHKRCAVYGLVLIALTVNSDG